MGDGKAGAINIIRQFMHRVNLQGSEVPAYIEAMQFLERLEKDMGLEKSDGHPESSD